MAADLLKLKLALKKVEEIIHVIKMQGKVAYINSSGKTIGESFIITTKASKDLLSEKEN